MKVQTNAADETLVALYAQGNNEAFDILLNRYKDRLYAYIYYTVRNEELAEDIFQGKANEIFIISPADNEVTELVTCFFSIVP